MNIDRGLDIDIATLPSLPGVYRFSDSDGIVIYVGKAKDLKKRVSSYFLKNRSSDNDKYNEKIDNLVSRVCSIKYVVVDSEEDAFLLENSFIKEYKPKYNSLLKDDKSYPFVVIKSEPFPRVYMTRKRVKDGSIYFGPYSSVTMIRSLIDMINEIYPLRRCKLDLSTHKISEGRYKVCLEYHIKNCKGPCIGEQSRGEYDKNIIAIKSILRGRVKLVLDKINSDIKSLSEEYRFEEAMDLKSKYDIIERYSSRSKVVNSTVDSADVFAIIDDEDSDRSYVSYLKIVDGSVVFSYNSEIKSVLREPIEKLLSIAIFNIRDKFTSESEEVIIPFDIEFKRDKVKYTVPQRGDKYSLIQLAEKNARIFKLDRKRAKLLLQEKQPDSNSVIEKMKSDLFLDKLPKHIECFDNSNIQGHYPVAACVVFKNGKPSNREYRHFHIKSVEGPDDFASMEEVVYRRYKSLLDDGSPLPNLIVVDGGKGQLNSAMKSLIKLNIENRIEIVGIAKKLEEIFKPGDSIPLYVDKRSQTLKIIQHLRDEAHRFGITFHRDIRSKGFIVSELDGISGIGPKTRDLLLDHFKSVDIISKSTKEELSYIVGNSKAEILIKYFKGLK